MNKIFRVIWNHATNSWTVVSELSHIKGKAKSSSLTKTAASVVIAISGLAGGVYAADNHLKVNSSSTEATATGPRAVAIGENTTAAGRDSASIGTNSRVAGTGAYAIAVGDNATAVGARDIFIGRNAGVNSSNTQAINNSIGNTYNNIGIGERAGSNINEASNIIAIGTDAANGASSGNNIAIGSGANSQTVIGSALNKPFNVAIGERTTATGGGSSAVGYYSSATGQLSTAIGAVAQASGNNSFAAGKAANASNVNAVAVGHLSKASGRNSTATGMEANASGTSASAYGLSANASGLSSTAVGVGAKASDTASTAIGASAVASERFTVAVGLAATAAGRTSIAIGLSSNAQEGQSIAIGRKATSQKSYAVALGGFANATSLNSTALGNWAQANNEGDVALGANSETSVAVGTTEATVNGVTYSGFAGTDPYATVSVGNDTIKRTITNVAAGRISATSTDAINGSQLYAVMSAISSSSSSNAGNWTVAANSTGTGSSTYTSTTASNINAGDTVTYTAGNNIVISGEGSNVQIATSMAPVFDTVQVGGTGPVISSTTDGDVKVAKSDGSAAKITNVAAGTADTDAVNVSQLKGVDTKINRNNKDLRAGIAGSNAAAGLPQVYLPGKSMVAASVGTFKNEGAVAVGYSRASDSGKTIIKLQGNANTRGDFGGSVGVGYQW